MKNSIYLYASLLLIFACSESQSIKQALLPNLFQPQAVIDQPVKDVLPSKQSFSVNNKVGLVIKTLLGSLIAIPANAFVDSSGKQVEGDVKVEIAEIFTPADIILSGIPMNCDNKGVTTPFISDGMFKLTAECEGNSVDLAKDKTISVGTPSVKKEEGFDYWYFNETSGVWENEGTRTSTASEDEVLQQAKTINEAQTLSYIETATITPKTVAPQPASYSPKAIAKPLPPAKAGANDYVFSINADYSDYPELETFKNVLWLPNETLSQAEQTALNKEMNTFGANVKLTCTNEANQQYSIAYGKKSINARPVLMGADKAKAKAKYQEKMKKYTEELKIQEEESKSAAALAAQYSKTYNLFAVSKMGIYNCDRFYSYKGKKQDYKFSINGQKVDQYIFAVLKNESGVISLTSGYKNGDHYHLGGTEIAGFVYTKPNGEVYSAKNERDDIQEVNDMEFTLRRKEMSNVSDLQSVLKELR